MHAWSISSALGMLVQFFVNKVPMFENILHGSNLGVLAMGRRVPVMLRGQIYGEAKKESNHLGSFSILRQPHLHTRAP